MLVVVRVVVVVVVMVIDLVAEAGTNDGVDEDRDESTVKDHPMPSEQDVTRGKRDIILDYDGA